MRNENDINSKGTNVSDCKQIKTHNESTITVTVIMIHDYGERYDRPITVLQNNFRPIWHEYTAYLRQLYGQKQIFQISKFMNMF